MEKNDQIQPRPLCGAKNRYSGLPCTKEPVVGKRRCWAHGGAPGSGAPKGNQNRLTHGFYTAEAMAERKMMNDYLKTLKNFQIGI
jgi:uncharacterized protein YjcR